MAKHVMHRNEVQKFLQDCVSRLYDKADPYSWDDYKAEEIEYIPLDLSAYPSIKPETAKWIDKLFSEETTDRNGNYLLRGLTRREGDEVALLNLSYGEYSDALSFWAYNDEEMLIYIFCEGDTTLQLFTTREQYESEKAETLRWYKEER